MRLILQRRQLAVFVLVLASGVGLGQKPAEPEKAVQRERIRVIPLRSHHIYQLKDGTNQVVADLEISKTGLIHDFVSIATTIRIADGIYRLFEEIDDRRQRYKAALETPSGKRISLSLETPPVRRGPQTPPPDFAAPPLAKIPAVLKVGDSEVSFDAQGSIRKQFESEAGRKVWQALPEEGYALISILVDGRKQLTEAALFSGYASLFVTIYTRRDEEDQERSRESWELTELLSSYDRTARNAKPEDLIKSLDPASAPTDGAAPIDVPKK